MHHKTGKRVGLALLAGAVVLRMLTHAGTDALALGAEAVPFDFDRFATLTAAAVTGAELPEPAEEPAQVWVLHVLPKDEPAAPPEKAPAPTPLVYTAEQAKAIDIGGKCTYPVDKTNLLLSPFSFDNTDQPSVLIVHTHTTEAYTQSAGWTYTETDPLRTLESTHSVVRVGEKVAQVLTERGISVLHDATCHDYPDYNSSYSNTKATIERLLTQYPTIQVVLDLHRDAIVDAAGNPVGRTVTLKNGTAAAELMLVVGTDQGGLTHPGWQENLSLALKLQAAGSLHHGDIFKAVDLRTERFNQHLSPGALLVEVGAAGNTLPEALAAAELLATSLADVLVGVQPAEE